MEDSAERDEIDAYMQSVKELPRDEIPVWKWSSNHFSSIVEALQSKEKALHKRSDIPEQKAIRKSTEHENIRFEAEARTRTFSYSGIRFKCYYSRRLGSVREQGEAFLINSVRNIEVNTMHLI